MCRCQCPRLLDWRALCGGVLARRVSFFSLTLAFRFLRPLRRIRPPNFATMSRFAVVLLAAFAVSSAVAYVSVGSGGRRRSGPAAFSRARPPRWGFAPAHVPSRPPAPSTPLRDDTGNQCARTAAVGAWGRGHPGPRASRRCLNDARAGCGASVAVRPGPGSSPPSSPSSPLERPCLAPKPPHASVGRASRGRAALWTGGARIAGDTQFRLSAPAPISLASRHRPVSDLSTTVEAARGV